MLKQLNKKIKKFIKRSLLKKGFRIQNVHYFDFLDSLLNQLIERNDKIYFLQIGANDGKRFDPIYEFVIRNKKKVSGIALEPIEQYYNELVKTYKNFNQIQTVKKAIHNSEKSLTMYKVDKKFEDRVPELAKGIASFNAEYHKKVKIPSAYMVKEQIDCISLEELVRDYKVDKTIDLLLVDAEGYDYEIISNLDFSLISPRIIHFEHGLKTGTMTKVQFEFLKNKLQKNDYQLFINHSDVTAYKTNLLFDF